MTAAAGRKKSNIRIVSGGFFADVVSDRRANPPLHHWIVQRTGSPEIVHWGQESTLEEAEEAARAFLAEVDETDGEESA